MVALSLERAGLLADDDEVRDALDPVLRSFRHLEALVEDLQAAVVPSFEERRDGASLCGLVEELVDTFTAMAEKQRVRLEIALDVPDQEVETGRLELILPNLIVNALRYADPEKEDRWVRVEIRRAARGGGNFPDLHFIVRDNGRGIAPDCRRRLLRDPSPNADGELPRSGMGLSIVRRAVERTGGRVWIESEPGEGTCVHFTLSIRRAAEGAA